jgi:hypothetical protein
MKHGGPRLFGGGPRPLSEGRFVGVVGGGGGGGPVVCCLVRPNVRGNRPAEAGGVSLARDSGEAAAR